MCEKLHWLPSCAANMFTSLTDAVFHVPYFPLFLSLHAKPGAVHPDHKMHKQHIYVCASARVTHALAHTCASARICTCEHVCMSAAQQVPPLRRRLIPFNGDHTSPPKGTGRKWTLPFFERRWPRVVRRTVLVHRDSRPRWLALVEKI